MTVQCVEHVTGVFMSMCGCGWVLLHHCYLTRTCSAHFVIPDPSMSPHEIPAKAETLPMTATQPANDTSLSDSSSTDVTMSPPSDSVSPSVNENASPEDSHKVSHDSSDNVSPTESDKVEQCESKDHPRDPLPINMFKLSLGNNNYVFDLD